MFEWLKKLLGFSTPAPEGAAATVVQAAPPVIGISGSNTGSSSVAAMVSQIRSAGAIPLVLANHAARDAEADLAKIDALIVMGNDGDIDPARYGESKHPKTSIETDKARERYEFALLAAAIGAKMPVLCVCGGMQRINVLLGGSLHQHVPDLLHGDTTHNQHEAGIAPFCPVQAVQLAEGSRLGQLAQGIRTVFTPTRETLPEGTLLENSIHHQAVDRVGSGLRIAARCPDGIAEAIEAAPQGPFAGQFLVGVQWHPEFGASPLGPRLAAALTQEAQAYAKAQGRAHPVHEAVEETLLSSQPTMRHIEKGQTQNRFTRAHPAPAPDSLPGHMARLLAEKGQPIQR